MRLVRQRARFFFFLRGIGEVGRGFEGAECGESCEEGSEEPNGEFEEGLEGLRVERVGGGGRLGVGDGRGGRG